MYCVEVWKSIENMHLNLNRSVPRKKRPYKNRNGFEVTRVYEISTHTHQPSEPKKKLFLSLLLDREAGQNGYTGVTIRGDDTAIESAKTYIQNLVAAK